MYIFANLIKLIAMTSANGACRTEPNFFGLVPWYHYLNVDSKCNVLKFNVLGGATNSDIPLIMLAVVDDLLRISGIVAVTFVIYGAIQYVVSQGEPEKTAKAQSTIMNALIGLAVVLVAVGAVSYIGGRLGVH